MRMVLRGMLDVCASTVGRTHENRNIGIPIGKSIINSPASQVSWKTVDRVGVSNWDRLPLVYRPSNLDCICMRPRRGVLQEQNRGEPPRSPSIISRPYFQTDSIASAIIFDGNENGSCLSAECPAGFKSLVSNGRDAGGKMPEVVTSCRRVIRTP